MRERTCAICEDPMEFKDYIRYNRKWIEEKDEIIVDLTYEKYLEQMWEDDKVAIMCCHCKDRKIGNLLDKNFFANMLNWSESCILENLIKWGFVVEEDIIELELERKEGRIE